MKTDTEFAKNLKNGIISEEMLEQTLYSINKRAKNWRDKKHKYRHIKYDKYHNYDKCKAEEDAYYDQKDFLLKLLKPNVIHHMAIQVKERKNRIYDYQEEYNNYINKGYWENCYFDKDLGEEVCFIDVPNTETIDKYYLYYQTSNHSFHTPIDNPKDYNLQIVEIDSLKTYGKDIAELVSTQFCNKLIELIKSGKYTLILSQKAIAV